MNQHVRRWIAPLVVAAITPCIGASVLAGTESTDGLSPVLNNAPALIQTAAGWHESASTLEEANGLSGLNPADATYLINGENITLSGGIAERPVAPGSAVKALTRLTDHVTAGDLNGDNQVDLVAVLTHDGGGSGTFYYLAAILHDSTPVAAAFLGDRIAVQDVRIIDHIIVVDLLTRGVNDPMTVPPYMKETRLFELKNEALVRLTPSAEQVAKLVGLNPADATYMIDGEKITLSRGIAEQPVAPGSATKAVTILSNRLAVGDLNGDKRMDVAAVLTHNRGGSGTFYFLAAIVHDGTPVTAVLLGDRIAVQEVRIVDNIVEVDLLTRDVNDPQTATPHVKGTRLFEVKNGTLVPLGS